jgi:hypothetical protein
LNGGNKNDERNGVTKFKQQHCCFLICVFEGRRQETKNGPFTSTQWAGLENRTDTQHAKIANNDIANVEGKVKQGAWKDDF